VSTVRTASCSRWDRRPYAGHERRDDLVRVQGTPVAQETAVVEVTTVIWVSAALPGMIPVVTSQGRAARGRW
jgi:hypothetical protein